VLRRIETATPRPAALAVRGAPAAVPRTAAPPEVPGLPPLDVVPPSPFELR